MASGEKKSKRRQGNYKYKNSIPAGWHKIHFKRCYLRVFLFRHFFCRCVFGRSLAETTTKKETDGKIVRIRTNNIIKRRCGKGTRATRAIQCLYFVFTTVFIGHIYFVCTEKHTKTRIRRRKIDDNEWLYACKATAIVRRRHHLHHKLWSKREDHATQPMTKWKKKNKKKRMLKKHVENPS